MTKDELIEKHRDINVDYDWWDYTYDHFKEDMKAKHVEVKDMSFSGFWSQGDGASFTGYIDDNKEFMAKHDLTKTYPHITKLLSHGGYFSVDITRTGSSRYVHENTVSAEIVAADGFYHVLDGDDPVREAIIAHWDVSLNDEYDRLAEDVTTIIRGYCRDLYKNLQEEYEYLTSDDAVWEAIEANELNKECV